MALSDTLIRKIGSWWQLRLTWTATQNVSANTSTVTAKLYWEAIRDGVGYVNSSSSRSASVTINADNEGATVTAGLASGGSKLLKTHTVTILHNPDGTKTFNIAGIFDLSGVYLSGVDYGSETVSGTFTLNTIPRASSLSSSPSFTAGSNSTVSVSRSSTAFRHEVILYVKNTGGSWVSIKRLFIPASATSINTSFSLAETTEIFETLAQRSSAETQVIVQTYKDTTVIGSKWYYGTMTAPDSSTTSYGGSEFTIGDTMAGTISQDNSAFTHTIQLIFTGTTYTLHNKTTVTNWAYDTDGIASSLYAKMANTTELMGVIRIYTYYNGVQVRSYKQSNIKAVIAGNEPSFSSADIAYDDITSSTLAITGNNQYIVQGKSSLRVQIINPAVAKNGASISSYSITVAGKSSTMTTTGYRTIGTIDASTNVTLTVKAIDSRGLTKTVTKTVLVIPYVPPTIFVTANRAAGFESTTTLSLSGSISLLKVGGITKNDVLSAQYQFRVKGGSYNTASTFPLSKNLPNFVGSDRSLFLDNSKSFDINVIVTDKLGATSQTISVQVGQPILFIDWEKKSIAFNDFPKKNNEFRLNGQLVVGPNMWNGGAAEATGGIDMQNSDIVNLNSAYFGDPSNTNSEGLMWLKSGKAVGSSDIVDYDQFRIMDGIGYLNGKPVFFDDSKQLWSGGSFMTAGQFANSSKNISDCPNGWVLVWSEYNSGSVNNGWQYTYIPKSHTAFAAGGGIWIHGIGYGAVELTKYIYVNNSNVEGHSRNSTAPQNTMVLRYIYSI